MDLKLAGLLALVTGGSRGVGHACATALLNEGARVVLVARDPDRLERARASLAETHGDSVMAEIADLGDDSAMRSMVERVEARAGVPDILVNAGATVAPADFLELDEAAFRDGIFEQKLFGYARALRHVLPRMAARGSGRVVNIAGLGGRQPHITTIPVNLNNAAVLSLSKALATQYAPRGIGINTVVPHMINTDRQEETMQKWAEMTGKTVEQVVAERMKTVPLGRLGRAEEVAAVVTFLASPVASFVVGAVWHVDGGVAVSM